MQKHSGFIPLKHVYPEALLQPQGYEYVFPKNPNASCNPATAALIIKRVKYLFNEVMKDSSQIIAYFSYIDSPNRMKAAVFQRVDPVPNLITVNTSAFDKLKSMSLVYTWKPTLEYVNL